MTISYPTHWKEPYYSGVAGSPKYDKICEIIDAVNVLSGTDLTGTGTDGTITKWTGLKSLGDSIITESGSEITIAGGLQVNNDIYLDSDTGKLYLGEDQDMEIWHNDTDGYIDCNKGALRLYGQTNVYVLPQGGYAQLKSSAGQNQYFDAGGIFYWRDEDASQTVRMTLNSSNGTLIIGKESVDSDAYGLMIERVATASGEASAKVMWHESFANNYLYGLSICYQGDAANQTFPTSGHTISLGNGMWGIYGHSNSINGNLIMYGDRAAATIYIPNATIYNNVDNHGFYTGAGNDLHLYHDGSHNYIDNNTGVLYILSASTIYMAPSANYVEIKQQNDTYGIILRQSGASTSYGNIVKSGGYLYLCDDNTSANWALRCSSTNITSGGNVNTKTDKTYDLGVHLCAWDDIYYDDLHNESKWKTFLNPLELIKQIGGKVTEDPEEDYEHADYLTFPDWVRTIDKTLDENGEPILDKDGYNIKWISNSISTNRLQMIIVQAIQELEIQLSLLKEQSKGGLN